MILNRIRAAKEARDMTNQHLADLSGVPLGTINRILSGKTASPNYITVVALCRALDISIDEAEGIKQPSERAEEKPPCFSDRAKYNIVFLAQTNFALKAENEKQQKTINTLTTAVSALGMSVFFLIAYAVNQLFCR